MNYFGIGDDSMPKSFNSKEALMAELTKIVSESMQKEVFEEVAATEQFNIIQTVYQAYPNPSVYERRGTSGGLLDIENIEKDMVDPLTMSVQNTTPPNPYARDGASTDKDLPELIEYGHGYKGYQYDYPGYPEYTTPRPFTANTIKDLEQSGAHIEAMKRGLRKRGLSVK
jgi:hypothetical protein